MIPNKSVLGNVQQKASLFSPPSNYMNSVYQSFVNKDDTTVVMADVRSFIFKTFYQPYAEILLERLNDQGFDSLFDIALLDATDSGEVFKKYDPDKTLVQTPYPGEKITFELTEYGSAYNWMHFYHVIVLIVETLIANNKNDEAIQWIETCLYNPKVITAIADPKHAGSNAKFWKLPKFKDSPTGSTEKFFQDTSEKELQDIINELNENPFNPFLVAYHRPQEFMMHVVSLYVKAHINAGDTNFRMIYNGGGMDYLNLALEYYRVAKIQLGDRPQTIPNIIKKKPETYQSLKDKGLSADVNAKVQYENIFPFCSQATLLTSDSSKGSLLGGALDFYFNIPPDKKILELYDLVDLRLSYLRNCKDIDGIVRKIDLWGTPIRPDQLLAALAKGLSLNDILGGLYAPAPLYRFNFLLQKAIDACNEVKALGNSIVAAIEKWDAEQLALLRSTHETDILSRMLPLKERQLYESRIQKDALLKSRQTAQTKLEHYTQLLGIKDFKIPTYTDLPAGIDGQSPIPVDTYLPDIKEEVDSAVIESGEKGINLIGKELQEMQSLGEANESHFMAGGLEALAATLNIIPSVSISVVPFGMGTSIGFSGANIAAIFSSSARYYQSNADGHSYDANKSARFGGYIRREQEWNLQANLAQKEIIQLDKQLAAADIRVQIATTELENHKQQMVNALEIENFMVNKESNLANYQSIRDILKPIHKNFYELAMYYARSAEQAYQLEKPEKTIDFIQYNYDNSFVGYATIAETLQRSLKEMEKSYLLDKPRPLEMKVNFELSRLDPLALIQLRKTGSATFKIPEWLLLLKNRGIYNAKWISVNFTFPMITGPYTNMSALVTLQHNYIRIKADGGKDVKSFEMKDASDNRFVENNTPFKEIIVSTGMNDQGYNLDSSATANEVYQQQYHPFVHAGFISEWNIDLNSKTKDFDYSEINWDTLADVIISGVVNVEVDNGEYKNKAETYLTSLFAQVLGQPLMLFVDIKRDFSNELYKFKSDNAAQQVALTLNISRFPYLAQNKKITITGFQIITKDRDLAQKKLTIDNGQKDFAIKSEINDYTIYNVTNSFSVLINNSVDIAIPLGKQFAEDSYIIVVYKMEMKA
ncbi:MAG TPA: hypothetical protein VFW07_07280 [Parafilimonas sp.]|nr:hypothetical protein [Parafilimonas sp.]